jgi:hypothetical protein
MIARDAMPKVPTRKERERNQERIIYEGGEKLKVLKRYAQQELDKINQYNYWSWSNGHKRFLEFVLESEYFGDIPCTAARSLTGPLRMRQGNANG